MTEASSFVLMTNINAFGGVISDVCVGAGDSVMCVCVCVTTSTHTHTLDSKLSENDLCPGR